MIAKKFQSICPICEKSILAEYVTEEGRVYIKKNCSEHGDFKILASEDSEEFEKWINGDSIHVAPKIAITKGINKYFEGEDSDVLNTECPHHCGVCENHLMTACCVLVNITSACNQHCPYCFASAENEKSFSNDPTLDDLNKYFDKLLELGEERTFNIQLSGGEPTVRKDLPEIIKMCSEKGFAYIQLNTNGRKLAESVDYCKTLKEAGVSAIFMQFDGVDDNIYQELRAESLLEIKKAAIKNCSIAGLPVTLVPTVLKDVNLDNIGAIVEFMLDNLNVVKGVHFQPASFFGRRPDETNIYGDFDERVTLFSIMDEIEKQTNGKIRKIDLKKIDTGHPLCCFSASFLRERTGEINALHSAENENEETGCCEPENSCCAQLDPLDIIRRDRDFVVNKWDIIENSADLDAECCSEDAPMNFDDAIKYIRSNMFTISGMAFMDATNMDAERLRRCRVQVFTPDERLVPFCGYYGVEANDND